MEQENHRGKKPSECDNLRRLTARQESAIELLISGKSNAVIARTLGIHRSTLGRWRDFHPAFQAELCRRRAELFGFANAWINSLIPRALDVLESSLDGPDKFQAAVVLLKFSGLQKFPPPIETGDAEEILEKLIRQRVVANAAERERRMSPDARALAELMVGAKGPDLEEERLCLEVATHEVESEIRRKLAEEQR